MGIGLAILACCMVPVLFGTAIAALAFAAHLSGSPATQARRKRNPPDDDGGINKDGPDDGPPPQGSPSGLPFFVP